MMLMLIIFALFAATYDFIITLLLSLLLLSAISRFEREALHRAFFDIPCLLILIRPARRHAMG